MTETTYLWHLTKEEYGQTELINWGLEREAGGIFICDIIPSETLNTIDKPIYDLPAYIKKHHPKYTFDYLEFEVNPKTLEIMEESE